jgi:hypothetical protein
MKKKRRYIFSITHNKKLKGFFRKAGIGKLTFPATRISEHFLKGHPGL